MLEVDDILSLDEAAEILGRSPATLRWAAKTGRLQAKRLGLDWATSHGAVIDYAAMRLAKRLSRAVWGPRRPRTRAR